MLVGVAGTVAGGGVPADIVAIVVDIVTAIVVAHEQDTEQVIVPGSVMRTNETCTTVSVIRPDPRRKVRPATPHARAPAPAAPDRTTSMLTRMATLIAEMIRVDGTNERRMAGKEISNSPHLDPSANQANSQAASHHRDPLTIVHPEISN